MLVLVEGEGERGRGGGARAARTSARAPLLQTVRPALLISARNCAPAASKPVALEVPGESEREVVN